MGRGGQESVDNRDLTRPSGGTFVVAKTRRDVAGHVSNKSYVETREIGVTTRHQTKAGNQKCFEKLSLSQLSLSHSLTLDILNNFCFHVYAPKSLFISAICNEYFLTPASRDLRGHRAGSQLKIKIVIYLQGYN